MLVGRDPEQQVLARLMAGARLGSSGVLVITGEPGVGKTALLEHTLTQLEGMRVLRGTGVDSEREIPFGGLLQLLRPALGLLGVIPQPQADALVAALALQVGSSAATEAARRDRFAVGAGVLGLLCRYAEDGPVAVVVEDLHLFDRPSAEALLFAARRLSADPILLLATARAFETEDLLTGLPGLHLEGLDIDSARALTRAAREPAYTDEELAVLHRATAGNPLAMLELSGSDRDIVESVASGLPLRVPVAVTEAFSRRLSHLGEACSVALLVAAVSGGDLRVTSEACAALGVDVAGLGEAEDSGLVTVGGGQVAFRHPLVRAAAYSRASAAHRRAAHLAVAGVLPLDDVDRRAWHLSEAVWHPDTAVADLLAETAENAVRRTAYAVASAAFERSARLSPGQALRRQRVLRAAETAWLAGQGARALALLDGHARDGPASASARELELRGAIAAHTGSLRAALELLLAAADRSNQPDEQAVLLADAVHAAVYLADARVASALADRLVGLAGSVTTPRARSLGLIATGIARVLAGDGGIEEIRSAVPLLESTPDLRYDPRQLPWLMLAPLFLRDSTGGARLRSLVEELRESARVGSLPAVLFYVARDQATTSAWSQAEANYAEGIRLATETGETTELAMSLAGLCWLESREGRDVECRAHAEQALVLCVERDIHFGEAWTCFALGDLELALGRPAAAVAQFRRLMSLLDQHAIHDVDLIPAPELTEALLRLGAVDDAAQVAVDFHARAREKGQPWALSRSARARAHVADDVDMDAWFHAALDWHAQTLDRFETARTNLAYGERLRRVGRRVDARSRLHEALREFDALGAVRWSEHTTAELTATGETIMRTGKGAMAALTPQELQVSLLLAEGRTTREAAAALFLSPKTIEYHLRKVYAKLSVRSRADLAAVLAAVTDQTPAGGGPHERRATADPESVR